jgi:hypothetical protein
MKINNNKTSADGTSLKGYLFTTYENLVNLLGQPLGGSADGKTTCEWILEFDDGSVATIHDWKTGNTPKEPYRWSIGGKTAKVIKLVEKALNLKTEPFAI